MEYILINKVVEAMVQPLSFAVLAFLLAGLLSFKGWGRSSVWIFVLGLLGLFLCSTPKIAYWSAMSLESQYPVRSVKDYPKARFVVILGGAIGLPHKPRLYPDLGSSSDRLFMAHQLYKAGKAQNLFISGGNVFSGQVKNTEGYYTSRILEAWGVPGSDMTYEGESTNTYENALETWRFLQSFGWDNERFLLVTSALHMPRAIATFQKIGLKPVPVVTDLHAIESGQPGFLDWWPDAKALALTTQVMHEYVGIWVYRLQNYL